jgi:hypothetical protein
MRARACTTCIKKCVMGASCVMVSGANLRAADRSPANWAKKGLAMPIRPDATIAVQELAAVLGIT